jgi:hypothetical protein
MSNYINPQATLRESKQVPEFVNFQQNILLPERCQGLLGQIRKLLLRQQAKIIVVKNGKPFNRSKLERLPNLRINVSSSCLRVTNKSKSFINK